MNEMYLYQLNQVKTKVNDMIKNNRIITLIPGDDTYDPCMFYCREGVFYTYSPNIGLLPRPDFTKTMILEHFIEMLKEGGNFYESGYVD